MRPLQYIDIYLLLRPAGKDNNRPAVTEAVVNGADKSLLMHMRLVFSLVAINVSTNYFICQLFYMELSNFNSLDIGAHICEDHFLKFPIECTLCADIAERECGKKTR